MRTFIVVLLGLLALQAFAIPYKEQIALLNSLQVGRKQDPMNWNCVGCDASNKPIRSHIIKEDNKDIVAILSVYNQYTVLAFRYTATAKNIWQDLLWAIQVQDEHAPSGCKVQKQYDNMWNSIRKEVQADLVSSSHTKRLIITGISLGGGLAMISYVDISHYHIFDNIEIITFGSPRVGNQNWAKWMESITNPDPVHICIKGDPICVLPRCITPLCNYKHSGTGYSCDKNLEVCTPTGKKSVSNLQDEVDQDQEQFDFEALVADLLQVDTTKLTEQDDDEFEVGGILDHIYGYKKLKNYAWVN